MRKVIVGICIIFLMQGCSFRPKVGSPWMQDLLNQGPEGSTLFKLGWRDGCQTGISATSNAFQRHFYTFTQDYQMAQDPEYYTGWKTAWTFCQRYAFQYLRRSIL